MIKTGPKNVIKFQFTNLGMQTLKIFLASSAELDADKEQLELFISRKNKDYQKKRVFLELSTWKDFISAMTEEHTL